MILFVCLSAAQRKNLSKYLFLSEISDLTTLRFNHSALQICSFTASLSAAHPVSLSINLQIILSMKGQKNTKCFSVGFLCPTSSRKLNMLSSVNEVINQWIISVLRFSVIQDYFSSSNKSEYFFLLPKLTKSPKCLHLSAKNWKTSQLWSTFLQKIMCDELRQHEISNMCQKSSVCIEQILKKLKKFWVLGWTAGSA